MLIGRSRELGYFAHFRASDPRVFALVIDVQQLAGLTPVKKKPAPTNELQRIPFRGVVTGGNRNTAMGPMMTDQELNGWHGTHTDIEDATAAREQARDNRLFDHFTRGA